jgi:hypothetical protein
MLILIGCRPSIDRLSKRFAWLEMRNQFLRDGHLFARTGVASQAGRTAVDRKTPEPSDLNAVTAPKGIRHCVQDRFHRKFSIAVGELAKPFCQTRYEIGSSHDRSGAVDTIGMNSGESGSFQWQQRTAAVTPGGATAAD